MLGLLRVFVGDVEADVVQSVYFHLAVNSTSHNVAGSQREPLVVFLHELLAVGKPENAAIATHRLCDEVGGMRLLRVVEDSRMELHELHILHLSLGTIDHSDAVAGSDIRIGCGGIDGSCAACRHERDLAQVGVHLAGLGVQDVSTVALDVGRAASDADAQVVLGDNLDGKVMLQHFDVWILTNGSHQSALYFGTGIVGMMQDAELRVTAFAMQVELTILFLVEVYAPFDEVPDTLRRITHHLFHGCGVADVVARNHGVLNVLLEVIDQEVRYRSDAALSLCRIGFFEGCLADERHLALACVRHLQRIAHTSHATAYNQEFTLLNHDLFLS